MSNDTQISKFLSLVLRHAPEQAGLSLDANGWANFDDLCAVIKLKFGASARDIERIVDNSPKKRFNIEGNRIRAVQGHSVDIDLGLPPTPPPPILYHGTKLDYLPSILVEGLSKQQRQHVHLSPDIETALIVARRRRGKDVILKINAHGMARAGMTFFLSENGVWLTDSVPPPYLHPVEELAQ